MQELIIPTGRTDKQKAQKLDEMLRKLAHADAMRGVIMFELRMPGDKDRPLFQYLEEHGMTEESTFTDYIETVHNVSQMQAVRDLHAAIVWAAIQGFDLREIEAGKLKGFAAPPAQHHLLELHRLVKPEMEQIPNARGENRNFPVRAKNAGLIQRAWDYVQKKYAEAVEAHEANGEDTPPPKMTSGFIRKRLCDKNPEPNKPAFYTQAGVKLPAQKPKGRIGRISVAASKLQQILDSYTEDYENGIADVAAEDGWNKRQRTSFRGILEVCRDAIDHALNDLGS